MSKVIKLDGLITLQLQEKREAELHWRLARVAYELFKLAEGSDKTKLIEEAFAAAKTALEIDDSNFAAHKWMAITLNQISTLKGIKEQITQSYNVRHHMDVRIFNLLKPHQQARFKRLLGAIHRWNSKFIV